LKRKKRAFIHDGDSRQLMQINKKCRWQQFQKVGENQPRGVKGVDFTNYVLSIQNLLEK
jgi:hypothetical protein